MRGEGWADPCVRSEHPQTRRALGSCCERGVSGGAGASRPRAGRSWDSRRGRLRLSGARRGRGGSPAPRPRPPNPGCTLRGCACSPCSSRQSRRAPRRTLAAGPAWRLQAMGLAAFTPVYRNGNLHDENNLGRILILLPLAAGLEKNGA